LIDLPKLLNIIIGYPGNSNSKYLGVVHAKYFFFINSILNAHLYVNW
jgi:hypothetical protein